MGTPPVMALGLCLKQFMATSARCGGYIAELNGIARRVNPQKEPMESSLLASIAALQQK
jgi:hypothetical protein